MTLAAHTKTRSQQRIEQLVNAGRPLTDDESNDLYRALHADYMCKWRKARDEAENRRLLDLNYEHERDLLIKVQAEYGR